MIGSTNLDRNPKNISSYDPALEKPMTLLSEHIEIIYTSKDPSVFVKHLEASQLNKDIIRITPRHGRRIGRIRYINNENTEELKKEENYTEIKITEENTEYIYRIITS